ncbi:hypothetical protein RND71_037855 [Anisodus tanguticus]|uniref:Uncharacterized protein n=1 Tax=Anisodus tanguticus TaxID=243964 RepID=A0AAE1UYM5_9SOLA|nr:hypothetical protein RND71_037855 [Anisodus tanguticus]
MFSDKQLNGFMGILRKGSDYIEIECDVTVSRFGDSNGIRNGKLEIDCQCLRLSPVEFATHVGRKMPMKNWKSQIWVYNKEGRRENLWRTCLLKYRIDTFTRPLRRGTVHRDEFIRCTNCNKERRFLRRTKEECKYYHDAVLVKDWKCSDMPHKRGVCLLGRAHCTAVTTLKSAIVEDHVEVAPKLLSAMAAPGACVTAVLCAHMMVAIAVHASTFLTTFDVQPPVGRQYYLSIVDFNLLDVQTLLM